MIYLEVLGRDRQIRRLSNDQADEIRFVAKATNDGIKPRQTWKFNGIRSLPNSNVQPPPPSKNQHSEIGNRSHPTPLYNQYLTPRTSLPSRHSKNSHTHPPSIHFSSLVSKNDSLPPLPLSTSSLPQKQWHKTKRLLRGFIH